MAEYKMRGENGDPLHDLAEVCDYNESLIIMIRSTATARKRRRNGISGATPNAGVAGRRHGR